MRTAKSIAWTKLTSSKSDRTDSGRRHHARIRQPGAVARHGGAGRDLAAFARGLRPDSPRAPSGTAGAACLETGGGGLLRGGVRPGIVHRRAHRPGLREGTRGGHRQARGGGIEPGGDGHVWLGCAARRGAGCASRRSLRSRLRRLRHGGGARNRDAVHGLAAHFAGRRNRVCIDGFQSIRAGARGHALCGSGRDDGPTRAGRGHPRPANGMLVAITVINCTLASSGRFAIYRTASATCRTSITGSGFRDPSACGTPDAMRAVMSVAALPMSICPQAISYLRPSSEMHLVSPVMACLVAVYGAELGRGTCAEIEPLLTIRPPRGVCTFMILMASCAHKNGPVRLTLTTALHCS